MTSPRDPGEPREPTTHEKLRARLDAMTDEERTGVVRRLEALCAEVQARDAKGLCDNCDGPGAEPDAATGIRLCQNCRSPSPPARPTRSEVERAVDALEGATYAQGFEDGRHDRNASDTDPNAIRADAARAALLSLIFPTEDGK